MLRISIITPSYNQGRFIEQTIKSIVDQNYPNLEYFILDGGSTDDTVKIIKKYAAQYKFIKWRSHKDNGQVSAINEGLSKATGDIIAYINSDDYYLPGSFNAVSQYFQSHTDVLWLYGNCEVTDPKLKWTFFLKNLWPVHKYPFALKVFNTINQPAVFLSKKLVKQVGKFNSHYKYAFDYDYWLRCHRLALPRRLSQILAVFRVHSTAKGNQGFLKQFQESLEVISQNTSNKLIVLVHSLGCKIAIAGYKLIKS